ncbi:hypothetical protein BS78_K304400 [Paspalum vaginatum]|uniref:Uncharacterized protein n=1 Tax=Paspalum vaginatum TaxID=158149 RepID=A0A9W7X7W5_9POAL|nr:hypothetical protein BS78_K304400 [Paspalum vaginatum]
MWARWSTGASITGGGARSWRRAATRCSHAATATTRPRLREIGIQYVVKMFEKVVCILCDTEQPVSQVCVKLWSQYGTVLL